MDLYLKIQAPFDESSKSEIQIHNLDACFWLKGEIMVVLKNGQSRLASRYVLVLPLGQTVSELLSLQSLAQWKTESGPGAAGWRSEGRHRRQA